MSTAVPSWPGAANRKRVPTFLPTSTSRSCGYTWSSRTIGWAESSSHVEPSFDASAPEYAAWCSVTSWPLAISSPSPSPRDSATAPETSSGASNSTVGSAPGSPETVTASSAATSSGDDVASSVSDALGDVSSPDPSSAEQPDRTRAAPRVSAATPRRVRCFTRGSFGSVGRRGAVGSGPHPHDGGRAASRVGEPRCRVPGAAPARTL